MRYNVEPWRDDNGRMRAFAIWDRDLSPGLKDAGLPAYCSLGGEELLFMTFTGAWQWLAGCMSRGLDLEAAPGMTIRTYRVDDTGGVLELGKGHFKGGAPLHPGSC